MKLMDGTVEHRKALRRYVVLAREDRYWIALRGFSFAWRAKRYARYLERWGVTVAARVIDSNEFKDPFHLNEGFQLNG